MIRSPFVDHYECYAQALRNRGVAARLPLSVSSFAGSIKGARKLTNSAVTCEPVRHLVGGGVVALVWL